MKKGVPVSPGVAVARAYCVDEFLAPREAHRLDGTALTGEVARFTSACRRSAFNNSSLSDRSSTRRTISRNDTISFSASNSPFPLGL